MKKMLTGKESAMWAWQTEKREKERKQKFEDWKRKDSQEKREQ